MSSCTAPGKGRITNERDTFTLHEGWCSGWHCIEADGSGECLSIEHMQNMIAIEHMQNMIGMPEHLQFKIETVLSLGADHIESAHKHTGSMADAGKCDECDILHALALLAKA